MRAINETLVFLGVRDGRSEGFRVKIQKVYSFDEGVG